ncbi:MAG: type II toxin-antitoxin system ParD family antitoxin [Alphaproteobacteria bacterium]|nr:type II toxin-antitoxin system ParD family antitoxin [Alphaproteobacteria bacterium]MBV9371471.1 type II toxin-antitoxin system ParD family antitoxin [Alphaproteobacteria bacterium]MBV9902408.1 type II toxin-antitoxin system ParD family antitoxin [Alphaproteobacteria bacterium]
MNDQPRRQLDPLKEAKLEALPPALVEGRESGDARPCDMSEARRKARERALAQALQEGLESGEAEGFDIDIWLDERRREDGEAA